MIWTYKTTVDLDKPNKSSLWETIASVGNKNAHGFEIHVVKSGVPVDLSGSKVHLFAKRQDGATRHIDGKISKDNAAVAELDETCYEVEGELTCTISIEMDDASFSAACIYFLIGKAYGDAIVDPSHTIPSLTEILSQIEAIKSAAKAAQDAAGAANTAAGTASTAAQTANTAANGANTARDNANKASGAANTAAEKINNMTVTADALDTGSEATADLTTADGHYILHLGLPRGATGATPQISVQVTTGAPGSQASVSVTGTAENPVIHLKVPRGDTGEIGALKINGKTPDASGAVTLGAEDVDALAAGATAVDSAKLGGKAPEYYLQPRNLLDNSDFEIAQAGYGGKHGSTVYAADRWMQNDKTERTYTYTTKNGHGALKCSTATRIQQKLHLVDGQNYTAAFYINDTLYILNFVADGGSHGIGAIWVNHQSDGTYMFVISDIPAGVIVAEPVLYCGIYTAGTLPPYVPKGYAAELDACHERFYRFDDTYSFVGTGFFNTNGAVAYVLVDVPYLNGDANASVSGKVHLANPISIADSSPAASRLVSAGPAKDGKIRLQCTLDAADTSVSSMPCAITIRAGDYLEISRDL